MARTAAVTAVPSVRTTAPPELLRRLDLVVTRRLDGLLQGDYRGLVPGHGSELGETREYQPGDDVRRIDWNVTARTITPHVRETIADRELEAWVAFDASPSLAYGTSWCEKRDLAVAATAAVGHLTARSGNRVGAIILEGGRRQIVPARSGRVALQALLRRVVAASAASADPGAQASSPATGLVEGLASLGATMRRRGLAVVVSDFLDDTDWVRPMRGLAARHEVLAIEVVDPRELELPDVGVLDLVDPESGAVLEVQTADPNVREAFAAAAAAQRAEIAARLRRAGADHLELRTDRDWLVDLVRFVTWRRERVEALTRARR